MGVGWRCFHFVFVLLSLFSLRHLTAFYRILPIEWSFSARRAEKERIRSGKRPEKSREHGQKMTSNVTEGGGEAMWAERRIG